MLTAVETIIISERFGEEKAFELIKEAGFDGADYSFYSDAVQRSLLFDDWYERALKTRALLDKYGLLCRQSHAPFVFAYENKFDVSDPEYLRLVRSIEYSAVLGVKNIVIHSVITPYNVDPYEFNYNFYKSFEPYCEKCGIKISVENLVYYVPKNNMFRGKIDSPEGLNKMLDRLGTKNYSICVDIGHAALTGIEPDIFIESVNPEYLEVLHVQDHNYKSDGHRLPFIGDFDWEKICSALKKAEYKGDMNFEIFSYLSKFPTELLPDALHLAAKVGKYLASKL